MTQRAPINPAIIREVALFRTLDDAQVLQVQGLLREWHCRKGEILGAKTQANLNTQTNRQNKQGKTSAGRRSHTL